MMHKTCSINYGHLADLQKTLPTTDLNKKKKKKTFHLIKYLLATFTFFFLFNLYLYIYGNLPSALYIVPGGHDIQGLKGRKVTENNSIQTQ